MDTYEYSFPIRVLVYQEDGETIAHAIEMDIVADGENEEVATKNLRQLIVNQISFAIQKGEEHLVWRKAPKTYFDRWEAAQARSFQAIATDKLMKWEARATVLMLDESDIENIRDKGRKSRFSKIPAAV